MRVRIESEIQCQQTHGAATTEHRERHARETTGEPLKRKRRSEEDVLLFGKTLVLSTSGLNAVRPCR